MSSDPVPRLSLFICGDALPGVHAAERVQQWANKYQWNVEVIDVLVNPELAEQRRILATPTLVKEEPLPSRRVIGDLHDEERVFTALSLRPTNNEASSGA